jgi:hypothetical protein
MEEIWKPVVGFDGYEVSNLGRVRSWKKIRKWWQILVLNVSHKERPLTERRLVVTLRKSGKSITRAVHRLVLEAFIGPCPEGMEARHVNDNDINNNILSNLAWGTHDQNMADKINHGTYQYGEMNPQAKLSDKQADEIRVSTLSNKEAAATYGVSYSTIRQIRTGERRAN